MSKKIAAPDETARFVARSLSKTVFTLIVSLILLTIFIAEIKAAPGDLDPTFGGGKVLTPYGSGDDGGYAVAVQPDGKIVVAGNYYNGTDRFCALIRYNPNGTLDNSFGTNGRVAQNYTVTTLDETYSGVAIQSDGKIVAVGYYWSGSHFNFITARFNANGTVDNSFNGGGFVPKDVGTGTNDFATSVAIQSDGKIVVAGETDNGSLRNSAFVRYNANGTLDTTFGGGDGDIVVPVSAVDSDSISSIAIQPDGKIVGVGYAHPTYGGIGHYSVVRLTASGALDASFDGDGIRTTQIGNGTSSAASVALQPDGKIVATGYSHHDGSYYLSVARYNANGSLDTSFDDEGYLTTPEPSANAQTYGRAVKIQSDGKIVVAGQTAFTGGANNFFLARFNANGALDASFDGDGLVVKSFTGFHSAANAMALQADGKIIAAGVVNNGANNDFGVARFNSDGTLDATFAPGGKVTTAIVNHDFIYDAAQQSDGKIVVAGVSSSGANTDDSSLARYNSDGTLDTSFSGDGKVTTNFGANDYLTAVAVQPDGKIVAVGYSGLGGTDNFIVARFNPDGSWDTTFDGDGALSTDVSGVGNHDVALDVAIQTDGKIVVVGYTIGTTSQNDFAVVRYHANGSLDTSFDGDGIFRLDVGGLQNIDSPTGVVMQPDGKIVVVGQSRNGLGNYDFALIRLNQNGSLDATFDTDGKVFTPILGDDIPYAVALQVDGKIVVAGGSFNGTNNDFSLARYNPNGSLDTSFDSDGVLTTPIGGNSDVAYDVAIQSDGRIIAAGRSDNAGSVGDFAVVRYNTNGALDTTFGGTDGKLTTDINGGQDEGRGLLIQPDGKIILAGFAHTGVNNDFALTRYEGGNAVSCSYAFNPTSQNVIQAGANHAFDVATDAACAWTATTAANWIQITNGTAGTGSGTVSYTVPANPNGASRTGTISVGGQNFQVTQAGTGINVSIPASLSSLKNSTLVVPVNAGETTGAGIISYDFRVTYDANLFAPQATPFDKAGTLSSGFEVNVNSATPGVLIVSGFGSTPLAGMGALLNLKFNTIGNIASCGALNFTQFQFNEGNPASSTTNGQACVVSGTIAGVVTYANAATQTFVPNVTLSAAGSVNKTATTNAAGEYGLSGLGAGAYAVTPSKTGEVNGAVSALDASLIAQHVIGLTALNSNQQTAADVSANGTISSFDAGLIAQYVVSLPNPGNAGTWKFAPAVRNYPSVEAHQANQDYAAILMGDVTGNWTPPAPPAAALFGLTDEPTAEADETAAKTALKVGFGRARFLQNGEIVVPVTTTDLSNKGIYSFEFELEYDAESLVVEQTTDAARLLEISGALAADFSFAVNPLEAGRLKISAYGVAPLAGKGVLLNLKFRLNHSGDGRGAKSFDLKWTNFRFNEGERKTRLRNGTINPGGKSETDAKPRRESPDRAQEN